MKHLRHLAEKHHKAHEELKKMIVSHHPVQERILPLFLITFFIVLGTLLIFRNWEEIIDFFSRKEPAASAAAIETHGLKTGVLSVYKVDSQANQAYQNRLASLRSAGGALAAENNKLFGEDRGEKIKSNAELLKESVWLTNYLSQGQHLTKLYQKKAKSLQKSIIATHYIGEKTIDINSTLQSDTQLLTQIKNTLSVDLFQYLNQAVNRADALDEYLSLLGILMRKTDERVQDLQYKISFLGSESAAREKAISMSEKTFFENLKIFDGPNAEEELRKFIGLRETQAETKAKLGAYKSLQDYYRFFKPRLENLVTAIQANRAPLIAGVKVVEIQNMTLPLIVR